MSTFTLICSNQRKQRNQFILYESSTHSRATVVSPYNYNSSGELIYSQFDLDMRRKAEILKYQNKNNGSINKKWTYLSNNNSNARACSKTNIPISSTASGVPGPPIMLYYDDTIPLYKYTINSHITYQNMPHDSNDAVFDTFPLYNITVDNGSSNIFTDIVIINPDVSQLSLGFNIPISVVYSADFDDSYEINPINSVVLYIASSKLEIFYSDLLYKSSDLNYNSYTDDETTPTPYSETDLFVTCGSITIDLAAISATGNPVSNTGPINMSQLVGSISVPPIQISAVSQYVYTYKLTVDIAYSEFSSTGLSSNLYRTNYVDGVLLNEQFINNTSIPRPTSLTNVKIGSIINVENVEKFTNYDSNCISSLSIVDLSGLYNYNYITSATAQYEPFSVITSA